MNRRSFARVLAAGTAASIVNRSAALPQKDQPAGNSSPADSVSRFSWPREVAGVRSVDSRFATLAIRTLINTSPEFLVNHSARTFYFGALIGQAQKKKVDRELLFLACALHDLGLTEKHVGELPFELQGAEAARQILTEAGLNLKRVDVVWDGIAMHPFALSGFKRPEISLVAAGAGADVVGAGLDQLSKEQIAAVVTAFPRLGFKQQFVRNCAHVVERYPRAATRSFMRDIGEREVASFRVGNICDAINQAPFQD